MRPPSSISISGSLTADPPPQSTSEKASGSGAGAPAGCGAAPRMRFLRKRVSNPSNLLPFLCLIVHSLNNTFTLLNTAHQRQHQSRMRRSLPVEISQSCSGGSAHCSCTRRTMPGSAPCQFWRAAPAAAQARLPASYNFQRDGHAPFCPRHDRGRG